MIQTLVKPKKTKFDLSVSLPIEYVGKNVHILFYIDEEIKIEKNVVKINSKPSDFFGTLNKDEGEKMHIYASETRNEWEKGI